MMESGFCSPRAEKFPSGLRVLVVDDDLTWLKILEKMLKKCSYEVTTCCLARDALNLLRDRKDGFDLVISDVNMPDMDGFKLLEHVGLEMDLPVIMMSVDGETSRVMKGVQHGACDYLLKPIRMKELSNIWQHVMRKKIHEAKDTEYYDCMGNIQLMKNKSDDFYDAYIPSGGSSGAIRKRKDAENKRHDDQESADTSSSSSKKARVVWCVDLHQKFVDAVNQIGFDKIGPKKILDAMNVPGLTRENVASHLQKFRQYLDRLEKEKELKAPIGEIKQENFPSGDHPGNFRLQNSFAMDQNNAASDNFRHAKPKVNIDEMGTKEGDLNGGMISFLPARKLKNPFTNDVSDHQKASIGPQIDPSHSTIKSFDQNYRFQPLGLTTPTQQWNETPMMQFKQQPNQEPKPYSLLEDNYSTQLFSPDHHFQANFQHPIPVDIKTSMPLSKNSCRIEFPMRSTVSSLPLTSENQILNPEAFKATSTVTPEMKIQMVDPHCIDNWTTPVQQKIIAGEPAWEPSLEENIQFLLQEYARAENIEYQNYYPNSGLMAELQTNYHDELGLYCDKLHDPIGSPFVDQGLFIV